ncbi:hypothetical protein RSOLAG22IIIB_08040 [Rhizoctonia solani]|uniref:Uncharacterized protein n=1 Tax=Rhizoctonia solani TaxID=456999 RepID=A0A0K6FQW5_9AGAM|nr:hypothetical protein RSOLAG22IIIB_08040 [Rhizoctonia solani]
MRGADSSKVKHGVMSGLKLAGHVSMASATTSFYKKSGLSPDDSSDDSQTARNLLEQIVSIDDLQENAYQAIGRTSQLDILSRSLGHFRDLRGLTFYAEDIRFIWSNRQIRQTSVTKIVWYDDPNGSDNFLLLQLSSPAWERDRWLRLERRPWNSGLKGAVSWISPLIKQSFADTLATISTNPNDLMAYEEMEFIPRETSEKTTPLSFVLDIVEAVHKNCPAQSIASMSSDRLYLWIVMDAISRYHEPTSSDVNKMTAQPNNPYRILKPLARKKGCREIAEKVGVRRENIQDDWELVPEPVFA